ncbi:regenerating islet-derived protein 4 [Nycticebus coucang]|uniref:regenerating islet-derived protein 4 n=1 Tax=Nycticebus coucang TaxID=9470 RepID=UPI00234CBEC0|nr:regenerating islet-derived protein 4 [Nycticebus coucang]XP_053447586.1 regenerating islet-derived protein 4 [Nycticebus coucang]
MASKRMRLLLLLSYVASPEVLGDIIMRPSYANDGFTTGPITGNFWKLRNWPLRQPWQWIKGATYLDRACASKLEHGGKHCTQLSSSNNFLTWNDHERRQRQHFL